MSQNYQDKDVSTVLPTSSSPTVSSNEANKTGNQITDGPAVYEYFKNKIDDIDNIIIKLLDKTTNNEIKINSNSMSIMGISQDIETIHSDYTALEARVTALEKK